MCQDIDMIQNYFTTEQSEEKELENISFHSKPVDSIVIAPQILQLENQLALDHLSKDILKSEVKEWEVKEKITADYYGGIAINEGEFFYNDNKIKPQINQKSDEEPDNELQQVFFIYSTISFENWENFETDKDKPYQFFVFNRYEALAKI